MTAQASQTGTSNVPVLEQEVVIGNRAALLRAEAAAAASARAAGGASTAAGTTAGTVVSTIISATVPGAASFNSAVDYWRAGRYGWATVYGTLSLAEAGAAVLTFGESQALVVGTRNAVNTSRGLQHLGRKGPVVSEGATLEKLTADEVRRVQNAANRSGTEISVVGSRVNANKPLHAGSDYDYVIFGNNKVRGSLKGSLPGAKNVAEGFPNNLDIFKGPLDTSKPYVTFFPR